MLKVILVLFLFCGVSPAAKNGQDVGKVRCEASAVHLGGEGQLTCHYPVDLNRLAGYVNVAVQQFVDESDTHILDCLWDEIFQCTDVRQGYKVTQAAGNSMTITITNVTEEHEGRYRCVLIDKRTFHGYEFCNLTVTGVVVASPDSESTSEDTASNESAESVEADEELEDTIILVTAIVLPILFLIIVIAVACRACKYCRKTPKKEREKDEEKALKQPDASDDTEKPEYKASDHTEKPDLESPDATENDDLHEDEDDVIENDDLADLNKEHFETEVKVTAARMGVSIARKMSSGSYPGLPML